MSEPKKIIEISGLDWLKGISTHPYIPVGGLFQQATNFNPFNRPGIYFPSQAASTIGTGVILDEIRSMTSYVSSAVAGVSFVLGFSKNTRLYRIRTDNMSVENLSTRIANDGGWGSIIFKNKIVYAGSTTLTANSIPIPRVSAEVSLLTLDNAYQHKPHIGPDRNLYVPNKSNVARVTSVTGTTGNSASFLAFEDDVIVRGLSDDGIHLIIVGDTNSATNPTVSAVGLYRCFVAFWNMKSQDLTRIWEFKDNGVFGVQVVEDEVIIHGQTNIYTCSINSKPRVLMPKTNNTNITSGPPEPGSLVKMGDNVALWGDGVKNIYGYGRISPHLPKSFFHLHEIANNQTYSLFYDGGATDKLIAAFGSAALYAFTGTTTANQTSTTKIAGIDFKQPYEFSFAKVILSQKLSAGQSVDLEILTDEGDNTVLRKTDGTANSFSHTNFPGKKSHIFYPYPGTQAASSIAVFEDLSDIQIRNIGASVRRVEIWGKPLRPDQDVYK